MDRQEELAHDLELGLGEEHVDVGYASGNGVLNRDHGQIHFTRGYTLKSILKARARHAFEFGEHFLAREIRIGSGLTLVRNLLGHDAHGYTQAARLPNRVHPVTGQAGATGPRFAARIGGR
ncbi:hypothetical protein StoSoilB20_37980 [Arthrobacter sp. StoSoilB20]|nr:hypothetical protein StoSoilB20_37980 [Arthrobacter sp. StoSoilB20]